DTGWNEDALERYVATLGRLGQIHAPDETYSFCNTGFGVAGRLIEVATGEHFDRALRRRLVRPLGCTATLTLPQHALVHRVAVGHEPATDEHPARAVHRWPLARANGPMGGILAPPGEVLAFARLHMAGGIALNGTELLPANAVEAMAEPQIESPLPDEDQALAWTVRRWDGVVCLGQDGDTFGQRSYLRVIPQRRFAAVVLANSPAGARLADALWPEIVGDLVDIDVPLTTEMGPPCPLDDPAPFVGTYDRLHQRLEVSLVPGPAGGGDQALDLRICPSGVLDELGRADAVVRLVPVDLASGIFRATMPESGLDEPVVFTPPVDGRCGGVYLYGRLHTRV
ncbi:MAG TPA: serine hydrolase domain-containing protein, partial [Acidimicrobiales bacterium]